jgi:acylglycerol lipase
MLTSVPLIQSYRATDSHRLMTRVWPVTDAIADIVYLHGIVSHGGWYLSSCEHLAAQGFQVHVLERRGSGLNPDDRGDIDDWQTWLSDVRSYLQVLPQQRPRILLGISWGGVLAAAFAQQHGEMIQGVGLLCPGLYSLKAANRAQRAGLTLAAMLGLSQMRVAVPLQDPAFFTSSPTAMQYVDRDPLALRKITIRFARENVKLVRQTTSHAAAIGVPLLLMLGGRDPITDNQQTRAFAERAGHSQKRIIEYPDASHTLEFEDDPSQYFQDLTDWCRDVVQTSCDG